MDSLRSSAIVKRGAPVNHSLCHKPRLQRLLSALRLDIDYERGSGAALYYRDEAGREVEVVDLVGGFGSLLLGHSQPALVAEAQRLLAEGRPIHAQGSRQRLAETLARELARRAEGDYCAVLANSGTEAVEAALKHALLETGGRTIVALEGAFHGKTLGALQTVGNADFLQPFELAGLEVRRVPANDTAALDEACATADGLAGLIFEPILGEGGVRPLSAEFVQRAAAICAAHHVPLMADECQTGCGRTGRFLACHELGVRPDYVILSKSLGGGLAKIGAALILRSRYREEFDHKHTSTFGGDDYSCALALKTLSLVDEPLLARVRTVGERTLAELRRLQEIFPDVIADVRGRGLMIGLEFRPLSTSESFTLRLLSSQNELLFVLAGYLLHQHRLRVFPTLSDPWTLRLQPAACIDEPALTRLFNAVEDVCLRLRTGDVPGLAGFLLAGAPANSDVPISMTSQRRHFAFDEPTFRSRQVAPPPRRVAWLCHMVDADDLAQQEPCFAELPFDERERLIERLAPFASPAVMSAVDVRSSLGESVRLYSLLLPFTSRQVKRALDQRRLGWCRALIQQGMETARGLGCSLVSLGQYTSIVTRNGRSVANLGIGVTSGNTYTVALALEAILRTLGERGLDPGELTLAIAGAAGNIGQTCAALLAPQFGRTLLLGSSRPRSHVLLARLAHSLPRTTVVRMPAELATAQVVVSAINSTDAPFVSDHLGPGAIVCDVSVPASVSSQTAGERPDVTLFKGGLARLPGEEDLEIASFPLPRGQAFGCLAEGLLLGLTGVSDATFTGPITADKVRYLSSLARQHGFELAELKRSCVLGSERIESLHVYS